MSRQATTSWADVRKNVNYLGCYQDYAKIHPQYQDPKYYNQDKSGKPHFIENPVPYDDRLPNHNKSLYTHFLDGPTRVMSSIHQIRSDQTNPMNQHLHKSLLSCYQRAVSLNQKYFALQDGGICMASNNKEFERFGKASLQECKKCQVVCSKHEKPCGDKCIAKHQKCDTDSHSACAYNSIAAKNGGKAGGRFTNAVYEIKHMPRPKTILEESVPSDLPTTSTKSKFKYPTPKITDAFDCPKPASGFFDLTQSQLFHIATFTPENPSFGAVIDGSPGSGKTCIGLNILQTHLDQNWEMFWLTRESIKSEPLKGLYKDVCTLKLRSLINSSESWQLADGSPVLDDEGNITGDTREHKLKFIQTAKGQTHLNQSRYGMKFTKQRFISYGSFIKMLLGKTQELVELRERQMKRCKNNDFGYKTCIAVDEAHNLIAEGLPLEEREYLDMIIPEFQMFTNDGPIYRKRIDIYGSHVIKDPTEPIFGRDLIAIMLFESYRKSGKDAAKIYYFTGTPMSTSPTDLFWLLNTLLPHKKDRLSLNLSDYYDAKSLKLKDEMMIRFAAACNGRFTYYNNTQDPTKFAKKVFVDVYQSKMMKFHQDLVNAKVTNVRNEVNADPNGTITRSVMQVFNNSSLAAKISGPMFSDDVIDNYERTQSRLANWDAKKEVEFQTKMYHDEIQKAAEIFKMDVKDSDRKAYEKRLTKLNAWLSKNKHEVVSMKKPKVPEKLQDITDQHLDPISFEEWLLKSENLKGNRRNENDESEYDTESEKSEKAQKRYLKLLDLYKRYMEKLEEFHKHDREKAPKASVELKAFISDLGRPKTFEEWLATEQLDFSEIQQIKAQYDVRIEQYAQFKSEEGKWFEYRQVLRLARPTLSKEAQDIISEKGQILSLEEWYKTLKRHKPAKAKYTKKETPYLKFLIQDPSTGLMRLRTVEEFVSVKEPSSTTLEGKETRPNSFIMWHKKYDPKAFVKLMPYYCPILHQIITNIISLNHASLKSYGKLFKHLVFTFSTASNAGVGKGSESAYYGSRILASAFHARSDVFHVCTVYKKNDEGKTILDTSMVPPDKLGVAVLSSKSIPNIYYEEHGGNQDVQYGPLITNATVDAFNSKVDDKLNIIILDGAFTEGISLENVAAVHFANPGMSKTELDQAAARAARYCKSNELIYNEGIGAMLNMYFYDLTKPDTNESFYKQMIEQIDLSDKVRMNLIDVFTEVASQMSLDYWLNINVNEFNPTYSGEVVDYYKQSSFDQLVYKIAIKVKRKINKTKKSETTSKIMEYLVDADNIANHGEWKVGDKIQHGAVGVIESFANDGKTAVINYGEMSMVEDLMDLRLTIGTTVQFKIPYGVTLAQKLLNIASYGTLHPKDLTSEFIADVKYPENAVNVIGSTYRGTSAFTLLGFVAMLNLISKLGGVGTRINIVLPDIVNNTSNGENANFEEYSLQWKCNPSTGLRELKGMDTSRANNILYRFLKPESGISFLLVTLYNETCFKEESAVAGASMTENHPIHMNLLIYTPEWKIVERFDPLGNSSDFDTTALDARLYDFFQTVPGIKYMSAAESCPLMGLQRLQHHEKKSKKYPFDKANFCAAWNLFYMHARIMNTAQALKDFPTEKRLVYPIQFQRGLITSMTKELKNTDMTRYIQTYAGMTQQAEENVRNWKLYDNYTPFMVNLVRHIEFLQVNVKQKKSSIYKDSLKADIKESIQSRLKSVIQEEKNSKTQMSETKYKTWLAKIKEKVTEKVTKQAKQEQGMWNRFKNVISSVNSNIKDVALNVVGKALDRVEFGLHD